MTAFSDKNRDRMTRDIQFGPYRLTKDGILQFADGPQIHLPRRLALVLFELAAAQGAPISRTDLIERCWPDDTIADESLTRAIADLRRVFREHSDNFIQTVYGLGYRLNTAQSDVSSEQLSFCREAWHRMYQRLPVTLASAEDLFTHVVERAEGYLPAWLGLAETHFHRMQLGYTSTMESSHRAGHIVDQALKIDPQSAGALALKGLLLTWAEWDFDGAEALLERALELAPEAYLPNQLTAYHKLAIGQFDSAVHHAQAATKVRPLSATSRALLAFACWYGGDAETALGHAREISRIDALGAVSLGMAAIFEAALGVPAKALDMAELSVELLPESPLAAAILAYTLARNGRTKKARATLDAKTKGGIPIASHTMASPAWMELGEKASALAALHEGFATRCTWLLPMLNDPRLRSLDCEPMKSIIFGEPRQARAANHLPPE